MIGNKKDYSWLWTYLILCSVFLNIAVQTAVLVQVSKVQVLKEAELHNSNGWKAGKPEGAAFQLHLLSKRSRRQKRVKRYDRNAYRNWKPGDPEWTGAASRLCNSYGTFNLEATNWYNVSPKSPTLFFSWNRSTWLIFAPCGQMSKHPEKVLSNHCNRVTLSCIRCKL